MTFYGSCDTLQVVGMAKDVTVVADGDKVHGLVFSSVEQLVSCCEFIVTMLLVSLQNCPNN